MAQAYRCRTRPCVDFPNRVYREQKGQWEPAEYHYRYSLVGGNNQDGYRRCDHRKAEPRHRDDHGAANAKRELRKDDGRNVHRGILRMCEIEVTYYPDGALACRG